MALKVVFNTAGEAWLYEEKRVWIVQYINMNLLIRILPGF